MKHTLYSTLLLICARCCLAATIDVPGDYATLAAALGRAVVGDTVAIACGIYYEHDLQPRSGVTIIGEDGSGGCVTIDAGGLGRVMRLDHAIGVRVEKVTLQGGSKPSENGGGIQCVESTLMMNECRLIGNRSGLAGAPSLRGAGMYAYLSNIQMIDCTVSGNLGESATTGGGICADECQVQLFHCTIADNGCSRGMGNGAYLGNSTYQIDWCEFRQNGDSMAGGGGICITGGDGSILNSRFLDNLAFLGGGILCQEASPVVADCEFSSDWSCCVGRGAGIYMAALSSPDIRNCDFRIRYADSGAGLYISGSSPTISDCRIFGTPGCDGSGITIINNASPIIVNTAIIGTTSFEGAVYCAGGSQVLLRGCTLAGNLVNGNATKGVITCAAGASVAAVNTIVAFNDARTIGAESAAQAVVQCCDFFGNSLGNWMGILEGMLGVAGNIEADPLFCDSSSDDYHITSTSPCSPYANAACGLIGAMGIACGYPPLDIQDVPGDEGGMLRIHWTAFDQDTHEAVEPIAQYLIQRQDADWASIAVEPATCAAEYYVDVATVDIYVVGSVARGAMYRVVGVTADPTVVFPSETFEGMSIDNVAPAAPSLSIYDGETFRVLAWAPGAAPDMDQTCLYRGLVPGFDAQEPIVCATNQQYYNETHLARYYYRARTFDIHGNASEWSNEVIGRWPTPVPNAVPTALRLYPCQPNPFNPRTTIKYDLPEAGPVRLSVFDLAGRLVRTLVDEIKPQGSFEAVWDGRDATGKAASSGTYLARLSFCGRVETVRMGLIR